MDFFISSAIAQTADATQAQQSAPGWLNIVFIGGMFAFMYFVILRPQRKRQKEHQSLVSALSKGDEVVLTSGMLGKITKVSDDYVVVETGNNIELKFQKVAVHAVLPKGTIKSIDAA